MPSYNRVLLMGNITREPELKYLQSGIPVCNFGLAMNEKWTSDGEEKESVCFVEVEAWNKQAEAISEYLDKGSPIFIEGALKYESWEDNDGNNRNRLKVRLSRFQFVGGRREEEDPPIGGNKIERDGDGRPKSGAGSAPAQNNETTEDDIPF